MGRDCRVDGSVLVRKLGLRCWDDDGLFIFRLRRRLGVVFLVDVVTLDARFHLMIFCVID